MNRVGASLRDVVHHRTGIAAVLRTEIALNYLYLGNRVLISEEDLRTGYRVVVIGLAVQFKIVGAPAESIRREANSVGIRKTHIVCRHDTRRQQRHLIEAIVQRKTLKLFNIERRRNLRSRRIQCHGRRRFYSNRIRRSNSQRLLADTGIRSGSNSESFYLRGLEARCGNGYLVRPNRQSTNGKDAVRLAGRIEGRPAGPVSQRDLGVGENRAGGVDCCTRYGTGLDTLGKPCRLQQQSS